MSFATYLQLFAQIPLKIPNYSTYIFSQTCVCVRSYVSVRQNIIACVKGGQNRCHHLVTVSCTHSYTSQLHINILFYTHTFKQQMLTFKWFCRLCTDTCIWLWQFVGVWVFSILWTCRSVYVYCMVLTIIHTHVISSLCYNISLS